MFQSDSTRSGRLALMAANAFIPSSASEKSWPSKPARRKVFLTIIRIAVESSTIMIFTALLQIKSFIEGSGRDGSPGDIHFIGQLQHTRPDVAKLQYVRRAADSHRLAGHSPDDAGSLILGNRPSAGIAHFLEAQCAVFAHSRQDYPDSVAPRLLRNRT